MSNKIAYLFSKKHTLSHLPIDDFASFAESNQVNFEIVKIAFDELNKDTLATISTCDAVVAGSFEDANPHLLDALARRLNLYAKCAFKTSGSSNLTHSNTIIVANVAKLEDGEFASTKEFGREAVDKLRYSELEIERTARIAYELAENRNHSLKLSDTTAPKKTSALWRKIVSDINEDYPSVRLNFESVFEATKQLIKNPKYYDVILTNDTYFEAFSGMADLHSPLGEGTSTVAYLGETTVGLYATENPAVYSPLFDMLAIEKMLAHSFDLPALLAAWRDEINKVTCKTDGFGV